MTDSLLTESDKKEALSRVYAKALATQAGYSTSVPDLDRDSIDLQIHAGGPRRPTLGLQLKATTQLRENRDGDLPLRLPIKNYSDLRLETVNPRLLVVLELPEDESQWMTVTGEELVLRRRAYWLSLQNGHEDVMGQRTVTVYIPKDQVLNVITLQEIMELTRRGEI